MRLWRRAFGALKDQNSILIAGLSRRTGLRNPDIESAVIRATTHDEFSLDRHNIERACEWIRISPFYLKPFLWSISKRMEKTRSWIVALKGLYLMHHVICSNISCVNRMGRLPFDLSNFKDGHCREANSWPFEEFIRAYFKFLDHKSTLIFYCTKNKKEHMSISQELDLIQKLQGLIDLLVQIKPQGRAAFVPLIIDVMEGITIEMNNDYNRMCSGISIVLMNIYACGKGEAALALDVVRKAARQGDDLSYYFEFCREIGVVKGFGSSFEDRIPETSIQELEHIINEYVAESSQNGNEEKAIVVRENDDKLNNNFRTIITDNWEKFDDDDILQQSNPFASPLRITHHVQGKHVDLPDLISF